MPNEEKIKIALICSDQSLQDYLVLMLLGEDYDVKAYPSQDSALLNLEKDIPDLIISEFQTPTINGLDICKVVRKNFLFRYVPIIFILTDSELLNKARITYAGADDYIIRSALENELLLRVKLNLYRIARQHDVNPLTKLPGQSSLLKEIQKRIESKSPFAIYYADIQHFKKYNQKYGFKKGDEIIKYTGSLIIKMLRQMGSSSDFISHPQDDDFFFISQPDSINEIVNAIIKEFDAAIPYYYEDEDRKTGHFSVKNRKGELEKVPFLRIYLSAMASEDYQFINPAQVIQIAIELNNFCKSNFEKSMFVRERRKNYPFS